MGHFLWDGPYLAHPGSIRIVSDYPKLPVVSLEVAFAVVSPVGALAGF